MMPQPSIARPRMRDVFGFQVPLENYYLHQGHAWAVLEDDELVRVGLDDFSQKLLGPVEEVRLPEIGKVYFQDHLCVALMRQGKKASFEAPVDGAIEDVNPRVRQTPGLIHDDPYGEGWLFTVKPTNLRRNLEKLLSGEDALIWIDKEAHRLLNLLETRVGVTLPDGGAIVDDVYGNYSELGWRPLVQAFLLRNLSDKGLIPPAKWKKGT
jgi:glycine cleavage system H lipoate-binding protein